MGRRRKSDEPLDPLAAELRRLIRQDGRPLKTLEKDLRQRAAAKGVICGFSDSEISKWQCGQDAPNTRQLEIFFEVLNVPRQQQQGILNLAMTRRPRGTSISTTSRYLPNASSEVGARPHVQGGRPDECARAGHTRLSDVSAARPARLNVARRPRSTQARSHSGGKGHTRVAGQGRRQLERGAPRSQHHRLGYLVFVALVIAPAVATVTHLGRSPTSASPVTPSSDPRPDGLQQGSTSADSDHCAYYETNAACLWSPNIIEWCDKEQDGNRVHAQYQLEGSISVVTTEQDPNGGKTGCGRLTERHAILRFRVCEEGTGCGPWKSARQTR